MKTIKIENPTANNTLDSQLKKAAGKGYSCDWVWLDESTLYCADIETKVYWGNE